MKKFNFNFNLLVSRHIIWLIWYLYISKNIKINLLATILKGYYCKQYLLVSLLKNFWVHMTISSIFMGCSMNRIVHQYLFFILQSILTLLRYGCSYNNIIWEKNVIPKVKQPNWNSQTVKQLKLMGV